MEKLYRCKELASRYGVKVSTIWKWIRKKELPATKIGKQYQVKAETLEYFEK